MGAPTGTWLQPGERMLLQELDVSLWEYDTHRGGTEAFELAKSPILIVTDSRIVFLNAGHVAYEMIYSLPYLRQLLPQLKRQNDEAAMADAVAKAGQPRKRVQVYWGKDVRKMNASPGTDAVNILTAAEHPKGLLGPANYALMTEVTFRPVTMERVADLEQQIQASSSRLHRAGAWVKEQQLDWVIQWRTVHLKMKAKEQIDRLVGTLAPALPPMQQYVAQPNGLQMEYELPPQLMQGYSDFRPQ